jgi:hypothetical protein
VTVLTVPVFILRYEKRLQAKADSALPEGATAVQPSPGKHIEQFAPSYVAPRRLRIRSTAA